MKSPRLRFAISLLLLLAVIWGASYHEIDRDQREHIHDAETATTLQAQAFAENTLSSIKRINELLLDLRGDWTGDVERFSGIIRERQEHISDLTFQIGIIDADGYLAYSNLGAPTNRTYLGDREHFLTHCNDQNDHLFISKPLKGKISGKWSIQLTRPIYIKGIFTGVIVASVSPDNFANFRDKLNLSENAIITMARSSGELMARSPGGDDYYDIVLKGAYSNPEAPQSGNFTRLSQTDGIERVFGYYKLDVFKLTFFVAEPTEYLLRTHGQYRLTIIYYATAISLLLIGFMFLLNRSAVARELTHAKHQQELEKNQALLRNASDGIHIIDLDGHIIEASDSFCQMLGYSHEECIGMHVSTWDAGYKRSELDQVIREQFASRQRVQFETRHRRKDGTIFDVEVSGFPLELAGHPVIFNSSRDISLRKKSDEELLQHKNHLEELVQQRTAALLNTEAKASHILHSTADGLYGVDREGTLSFINPAACAMLGYTAEDVIGRSAHALFHHSRPDGSPYPVEDCPGHHAVIFGQEVRIGNEVYWHADGHALPVMYAIHPIIQNGENSGAVISFVDMSEQRAAAEAQERAVAAAENLARVRSEFLANMSHEIRTPLNGVLGFAEIGYRNYKNSEKARDAFAKIKISGQRLLGVINDILDFSKIEAGKLQVEQMPVDIGEVIEHAVDLVRERAEAKKIELRVEIPANFPSSCISDSLRMGQVLLNVLSNAVKFTEQGSIVVTVAQQDEQLTFTIADSGIGMNAEQLGKLFNPFQQADASATRKFGGTGLGLAISKRILELMGGEITISSQPGKGSTVVFHLPFVRPELIQTPQTEIEAPLKSSERALSGLNFLVAEDETDNQTILQENLTTAGARVVVVNNGREAVERIIHDGRDAYDIVLMDIQMPEMDGYEATQRILELAPDLPIIAQTAHAFSEEREKCLAVGMVGHIAKPIEQAALITLVQQIIANKGKE